MEITASYPLFHDCNIIELDSRSTNWYNTYHNIFFEIVLSAPLNEAFSITEQNMPNAGSAYSSGAPDIICLFCMRFVLISL